MQEESRDILPVVAEGGVAVVVVVDTANAKGKGVGGAGIGDGWVLLGKVLVKLRGVWVGVD